MKIKEKACYNSSSNTWNEIVSLNIAFKHFSIVASTATAIYESIGMLDLQQMS